MSTTSLLELSRTLHSAHDLASVMDSVLYSVREVTRYDRCWILLTGEDLDGAEVVGYALPDHQMVKMRMASAQVAQDRFLLRGFYGTGPLVFPDMREVSDADQAQVEFFGNRTAILVPMARMGGKLGLFVVGTFAEQGVLEPLEPELDFFVQITSLISVVADRLEAEAETAALEARLRSTQRLEALGRMAGEVSHDFNNMLVSIVGFTELAMLELGDHPVTPLLQEVLESSARATALTRQLLTFSRGQVLERKALDPARVIRMLSPMLGRMLPSQTRLELILEPGLPPVYADQGQLDQLLMNLVVNARDAMADGGRIVVEAAESDVSADWAAQHPRAREGRFVRVAVSDTGDGMAPEVLNRMFEPFFTTKSENHGTGLGLSVVDSVVKQHDGFVTVHSVPERGTTFHVYLPVCVGGVPHQESRREVATHKGGVEHILVVDDDPSIRAYLQRLLQSMGYAVSVAANGAVALRVLDNAQDVALVVSDLVMPEMGGVDLLARLKEREGGPRVLLMTGYAPGELARTDHPDVLTKPFGSKEFLARVRLVLDRS